MPKISKENPKKLKIVGIGASASGLQALEVFLSHCPVDSGLSFIIVQHLSPDFKSMQSSVLARKTKIPISVASDNLPVEPDHIYLIPNDKNIFLENNKIKTLDRTASPHINLPIDVFFTSLAKEKTSKGIGVILSGSGSDGTIGAAAIKEAGGVIFVQDPKESGFSGMPLSIINAGLADFVLKAKDMPGELIDYTRLSSQKSKKGNEQSIDNILQILKEEAQYDFTAYRRQTLYRRIIKRKNINKLDQLSDYTALLRGNQEEQNILANEFLIGVTRFFRDKDYFDILQKEVFPDIIASKKKGETIKLWVIGCVTGEEAYSIAILLNESLANNPKNLNFKIFATDINIKAIEKASKGYFGKEIANHIETRYLAKYFSRKDNGFTVQSQLRKHIIFSNHNILQHPPFNKMDLISCRNLLIYFQNASQEKTIRSILYALNLNGYLFLGSSESLGSFSKYFEVISHRGKIFKKKVAYDSNQITQDIFSTRIETLPTRKLPEFASELTIQFARNLALVTDSICICVNENIQVLEVYGSLRIVGTLPYEGFSSNLLKLLPKEFHVPIATAIRILSKSDNQTRVISKIVNFTNQGKTFTAKVIFDRFNQKAYPHEKFYLIAIKVEEPAEDQITGTKIELESSENTEIQQLQHLLEDTRENLQLTIEELESSNEEAQATNEELVSSNEELQSTNEELQSVNEELYTVNAELQEKNIELLELNSDIENLINSSNTTTLFLDESLQIRRFTPSIRNIIDLQDSDIGRPIINFALPYKNFLNDIKWVMENGEIHRKEIVMDNNRRFLQAINSYISSHNYKQGVVINYTDITDLRKKSVEIREKTQYLKDLLHLFPDTFFIFDLQKQCITYSNLTFGELIGYSSSELYKMKNQILNRIIHPDDLKKVLEYMEHLKRAKKGEIQSNQFRLIGKDQNSIQVESIDKPLEFGQKGKVKTILSILSTIEKES